MAITKLTYLLRDRRGGNLFFYTRDTDHGVTPMFLDTVLLGHRLNTGNRALLTVNKWKVAQLLCMRNNKNYLFCQTTFEPKKCRKKS